MLYTGRIITGDIPEEIQASKDPVVHQFIHVNMDGPVSIA
jgi:phospholipid/cholesterol/gamma-HCH transport system ATP-binding protein